MSIRGLYTDNRRVTLWFATLAAVVFGLGLMVGAASAGRPAGSGWNGIDRDRNVFEVRRQFAQLLPPSDARDQLTMKAIVQHHSSLGGLVDSLVSDLASNGARNIAQIVRAAEGPYVWSLIRYDAPQPSFGQLHSGNLGQLRPCFKVVPDGSEECQGDRNDYHGAVVVAVQPSGPRRDPPAVRGQGASGPVTTVHAIAGMATGAAVAEWRVVSGSDTLMRARGPEPFLYAFRHDPDRAFATVQGLDPTGRVVYEGPRMSHPYLDGYRPDDLDASATMGVVADFHQPDGTRSVFLWWAARDEACIVQIDFEQEPPFGSWTTGGSSTQCFPLSSGRPSVTMSWTGARLPFKVLAGLVLDPSVEQVFVSRRTGGSLEIREVRQVKPGNGRWVAVFDGRTHLDDFSATGLDAAGVPVFTEAPFVFAAPLSSAVSEPHP